MNTEMESDSDVREALNELSGDSWSEIRSDNGDLVDSIEDYFRSSDPLNPPSADILGDFYSMVSTGENGIVGTSVFDLDRQDREDTLYIKVTPDAGVFGIIQYMSQAGYRLDRVNLRNVETLWEEDGTQYFRSDKGYYATMVFGASKPTKTIESLIEHGCSPAEALDYWAVEIRHGGRVGIQEWSEHRDVSEQAVSSNRKEAIKKIPDEYSG